MARFNNNIREKSNRAKIPVKTKRFKNIGRKLNKLNFPLILGLYALHLEVFSYKTVETLINYWFASKNWILSIF
jgi:hypothetical protein